MVLRARFRRAGQIQRSKRIQATITHEGNARAKPGVLPPFRQFTREALFSFGGSNLVKSPTQRASVVYCSVRFRIRLQFPPYRGAGAERSWPLTTGRKTSG